MGIIILMLLEDMGVMSEIAAGEPLIPSQTWLCSKFPSSSSTSRFPYLHYSYPLPSAACSHTPCPCLSGFSHHPSEIRVSQ